MSWYIIDVNAEAMGNEWLSVDRGMLQFMVVRSKWTAVIIYSMEVGTVPLCYSVLIVFGTGIENFQLLKEMYQTDLVWALTFPFMIWILISLLVHS